MENLDTSTRTIFLSYSRFDADLAWAIEAEIDKLGIRLLRDTEQIIPSEPWRHRLYDLISNSDATMFLVSHNSLKNWDSFDNPSICAWEVQTAVELGKLLIPVLIIDIKQSELSDVISARHQVQLLSNARQVGEVDIIKAAEDISSSLKFPEVSWLRQHSKWISRAIEWKSAGKPDGALLRTHDISKAIEWVSIKPNLDVSIPEIFHQYLRASSKKEELDQHELETREAAIIKKTEMLCANLANKARRDGKTETAIRLSVSGLPKNDERARGHRPSDELKASVTLALWHSPLLVSFDLKASITDAIFIDHGNIVVAYDELGFVYFFDTTRKEFENTICLESVLAPKEKIINAFWVEEGNLVYICTSLGAIVEIKSGAVSVKKREKISNFHQQG